MYIEGWEKMAQTPQNQTLKDEFEIAFLIRLYKVEGYTSYYKLEAKISDGHDVITVTRNNPEQMSISTILEKFGKLYEIYASPIQENEKLKEGLREELLKLVSLILWNIYFD